LIRARYFSKFTNNLIGLINGGVSAVIVPKSLGPAGYGDFNFLRDSFEGMVNTIDLNSSNAHFVYTSRLSDSRRVNLFQFYITMLVGVLLITLVTALYVTGKTGLFWPGQETAYIYAGAVFCYLSYLATNLTNLSDSKGLTVVTERYRRVFSLAAMAVLIALFLVSWLDLRAYFIYVMAMQALMTVTFAFILRRSGAFDFRLRKMTLDELKEVSGHFYRYSAPLVVVLFVGFAINYFDRWFLQLIGGSVTQGYYSLSLRLATVSILFTSAMTPIFMQTVAKAHAQGESAKISAIFRKIGVFYFTAAFISIFFSFHSREVVELIGGAAYSGAVVPMTVMMLYPIHQTYGRFCGAVLLSTERTDLYRNITVFTSLAGVPLSFILLAPESYFGLDLGATGLALKTVAVQALSVNLMLFAACRITGQPFMAFFSRQAAVIALLALLGFASSAAGAALFGAPGKAGSALRLLSSGSVYLPLALLLCLAFPGLLGVSREELNEYFTAFLRYIGKRG